MKNGNFGKLFITSVSLLIVLVMLIGCGSSSNAGEPSVDEDGRIIVTFWHSMGGASGAALDQIVEEFNEYQDEITVRAYFQGEYEEALTTFHAIAGSSEAPSIMQVFDVGTMSMVNSNHTIPVQKFIDRDGFDLSVLEENVINYYRINDQLYSMPFNSSTPVMFLNLDAFRAAGFDMDSLPTTFEEVENAAQVITDHGDMGGFALNAWGWMWEQHLANQGALFMNNNNGRTATPTEIGFTWDEGLSILNWIERMVSAGTFVNYGRNWNDMYAGFFNQDVAMIICSSASATYMIETATFEVGIAFVPYPENGHREGIVVGGASLWMIDNGSEKENDAAWEFMQFVGRPDVQAQWHVSTGFLAINPSAYEEQIVIDAHARMPQLRVTIDQLQATTQSYATQGAIMDMIPQGRSIIEVAFEDVFNGARAEDALETAIGQLNQAIERANLARGD